MISKKESGEAKKSTAIFGKGRDCCNCGEKGNLF
jgi:hypothetical protein